VLPRDFRGCTGLSLENGLTPGGIAHVAIATSVTTRKVGKSGGMLYTVSAPLRPTKQCQSVRAHESHLSGAISAGIDVVTETDGRREYTGTMRLPATHLPNFNRVK
jgi:hypothetical protein